MTTKNELFEKIEAQKEKLWEMADFIFDHPEYRGKEYQACDLLTKYLTDNGFSVERSVGGYETSFRAEWKQFRMLVGWLALLEEEAYAAWNKAVRGEHFDKIKPLQ